MGGGKKSGGLLWSRLIAALLDKAHDYFDVATELNGFNGRGRVIHQIHRGANLRRGTLRRGVGQLPQTAKLENIDSGIFRFEAVVRDYENAGGVTPTGAELKDDL